MIHYSSVAEPDLNCNNYVNNVYNADILLQCNIYNWTHKTSFGTRALAQINITHKV